MLNQSDQMTQKSDDDFKFFRPSLDNLNEWDEFASGERIGPVENPNMQIRTLIQEIRDDAEEIRGTKDAWIKTGRERDEARDRASELFHARQREYENRLYKEDEFWRAQYALDRVTTMLTDLAEQQAIPTEVIESLREAAKIRRGDSPFSPETRTKYPAPNHFCECKCSPEEIAVAGPGGAA
jgi:hypothetical protein